MNKFVFFIKKYFVFLCLGICFVVTLSYVLYAKKSSEYIRIDMAVNALSRMVKNNGKFVYEIDFLKNKKSKKNNIVREMGSAYALAFAYNQTGNKNLATKLKKVLDLMETRCIVVGEDTCFISDNKNKIKVGATALGLLSELYYEQTSKDFSYANLRNKLVNALVSSYREGVGVLASPLQENQTSPYFDGETWFALSVYNLFYPKDKKVADLLLSLDETMFKIYKDKYLISFIHWGTMAASHRFEATKDEKFIDFLKTQFYLYVKERPTPARGSSTCSVSEGLSDIVFYVAGTDKNFAQKVFDRINQNKEKIEDLQVISNKVEGKKSEQFSKIHPKTEKYIGAFKNTPNDYKTRNDVTQHCLIALLKHKRASKKMIKN